MKLLSTIILIVLCSFITNAQTELMLDSVKIDPKDSIVLHGTTCFSLRKIRKPLILVNNQRIGKRRIKKLNPESIKSINVVNGLKGRILYGIKGRFGVILIETK